MKRPAIIWLKRPNTKKHIDAFEIFYQYKTHANIDERMTVWVVSIVGSRLEAPQNICKKIILWALGKKPVGVKFLTTKSKTLNIKQ
tara:strand:+ start:1544 stop:1801 length:258 start_codon:yes stop_codon:yes gene_type:complete